MIANLQGQKNFIIEGNIGAGKSTFLKIIRDYLNVQVVPEPCAQWQNVGQGAENLLEKFYADAPRWAYSFQNYAFVTRIMAQEQQAKINDYPVQILERSIYSDRYCFAKNCFELGMMTEIEWRQYDDWFAWLADTYTVKPSGFIYLRTDPDICYQRLLKRNRSEESAVPLNYLHKLHDKHDQWLVHKHDVADYLRNTPVLILNCNKDFEFDADEQERHMEAVVSFLFEHHVQGVAARGTTYCAATHGL